MDTSSVAIQQTWIHVGFAGRFSGSQSVRHISWGYLRIFRAPKPGGYLLILTCIVYSNPPGPIPLFSMLLRVRCVETLPSSTDTAPWTSLVWAIALKLVFGDSHLRRDLLIDIGCRSWRTCRCSWNIAWQIPPMTSCRVSCKCREVWTSPTVRDSHAYLVKHMDWIA